jgi:hypothetical protein
MRSTPQKCALLLGLCQASAAFQAPSQIQRSRSRSLQLQIAIDPNDIATAASHISRPEIPALMSTALSSALTPAHGHSNPLFGPPDPFLAAGKSIAPSAKALVDMGVTQAKTVGDMVPDATPAFQNSVGAALNKGWKVLMESSIKGTGVDHLPGFTDTEGIFGVRQGMPDSPESFALEVKWAAGYFDVMDKLPFVAFWYAMVEFFILRPGVDLYKEEIEDDSTGVTIDTFAVGAVRVAAFAFISTVTLGLSG